ncbi:alkaline phosphatase [Glaciibacter superstes]|uniref:alkaline phosphatase n=1 Tax=Glaciibacter superstes TaxID=501023 RepID=UPI003CCC1A47
MRVRGRTWRICQTRRRLRASITDGPAKNVILVIGDGMGDSEITIARNYAEGAGGNFEGIDALPLTGSYTTYSLYKTGHENAGKPDYVPDSAATGTAWATGTKSYDNAVSVDINGTPHDTLLELARANGLRTGNVTTSEIQDATPAVQIAHVDARSCYSPSRVEQCGDDALDKGGLGSISEQLIDTRADVTFGGGASYFEEQAIAGDYEGQSLFEQAEARGYQVANDAAALAAVTEAGAQSPVLGLFSPKNMPTRYLSTPATIGGADLPPVTCEANPDALPAELQLNSLTTKAIDLLDNPESEAGFFLQVESASIDKQNHASDACGQIGETVQLDEAVKSAIDFAKADGDTLVIVTADHAHTSQIVDSTPEHTFSIALNTADGAPMKVNYGTSTTITGQQHTGSQLRIAAYGPGGANVVGLTDQSDTFFTIANALSLNRDLASLSAGAGLTLPKTSFAPGEEFQVSATGFAGDRQLSGVVESEPVSLARTDVINGAVAYTVTAPTEAGEHTVTLTGAQTGAEVVANFSVTADGQPVPNPEPSEGAAAPGAGNGGGPIDLASAGAVVLPFALAAAIMLGLGLIALRRRRGAIGEH